MMYILVFLMAEVCLDLHFALFYLFNKYRNLRAKYLKQVFGSIC